MIIKKCMQILSNQSSKKGIREKNIYIHTCVYVILVDIIQVYLHCTCYLVLIYIGQIFEIILIHSFL